MLRKIFIIFILANFVVSCVTGDKTSDKSASQKTKEAKKKDLSQTEKQDVTTVDTAYVEDIKGVSNFDKNRSKYNCNEYQKIEKQKWRDLVDAGYSCIRDKNWGTLSEVATLLSHNHLKAPWGPYFRSIVSESKADYSRALWMIELANKKAPNNPLVMYQKARILWGTKNETEAYNLFKEVYKLNSNLYEVPLFLGFVEYRDRNFKEAIAYFQKVEKYVNRNPEFNAALAESYFFTNDFKKSLPHYKSAVSREDLNASLYYKIGLAYKNLKDWNQAKSYFEKALSQRRRGRSIASFDDSSLHAALKEVDTVLSAQKSQGKNTEKPVVVEEEASNEESM